MFLLKMQTIRAAEARVQVGRLFDTCGHGIYENKLKHFLFLLIILVDNLSFNESLKTICKFILSCGQYI